MRYRVAFAVIAVLLVIVVVVVVKRDDESDRSRPASGSRAGSIKGEASSPDLAISDARKDSDTRPSAAAARAPLNIYLSGRDLFDAYRRFKNSASGEELLAAQYILRDCYADTRAGSTPRKIVADRVLPFANAAATPKQIDAARETLERCAGFETMTEIELRPSLTDIDARLQRADDPVGLAMAIAAKRRPDTPELLRVVLASQDPAAIAHIDRVLAERWRKFSPRAMSDADFGLYGPSMKLVACDLGNDCGTASRDALASCMFDASNCGLDVREQVLKYSTPLERQRIDANRFAFLRAITSGDYSIWGLQ